MKKNWLAPLIILLSMICATPIKAQSLVIKFHDGSEITNELTTIQKLTFSEIDLMVDFKSGSADAFSLSDIRKLYFETGTWVAENSKSVDGVMVLYPNPASTVLNIKGITKESNLIRIFRSDGTLVESLPVTGCNMAIDVTGLRSGLYFINAMGCTSKFIKL